MVAERRRPRHQTRPLPRTLTVAVLILERRRLRRLRARGGGREAARYTGSTEGGGDAAAAAGEPSRDGARQHGGGSGVREVSERAVVAQWRVTVSGVGGSGDES
jgi:hypothetical protein